MSGKAYVRNLLSIINNNMVKTSDVFNNFLFVIFSHLFINNTATKLIIDRCR